MARSRHCSVVLLTSFSFPNPIYDLIMLTESLSTSLTLILFYLAVALYYKERTRSALIIGALSGFWILIRPNNVIYLIAIFFLLLLHILFRNDPIGYVRLHIARFKNIGVAFLAIFIIVLLWCGYNYHHTHRFTLTNLDGATWSNMSYNLWDRADKKDEALASIMYAAYVKYDGKKKDFFHVVTSQLWENAYKMPLKRRIHPRPAAVNRYITDVSVGLLLRNKSVWLANAYDNFKETFVFDASLFYNSNTDPRTIAGTGHIYRHKLFGEYVFHLTASYNKLVYCIYLMFWVSLIYATVRYFRNERNLSVMAILFTGYPVVYLDRCVLFYSRLLVQVSRAILPLADLIGGPVYRRCHKDRFRKGCDPILDAQSPDAMQRGVFVARQLEKISP